MNIDELESWLADLKEQHSALALLIGSLERYVAVAKRKPQEKRSAQQGKLLPDSNGTKPTEPKGTISIRNAIIEVLKEAGRPMKSPEIWELAYQRGARTGSKRPEAIAALNAYGIPGVRKVGPRTFEWVGEEHSQHQP